MGFRTGKFMTGVKSKKAFKTLSVAALAGVATLSVNATAQASDIAEIPTPNAINIALPTPTHGDNAGYTLTEITNKTDSSITLYEVINNETKPHYYEYTIKDGASVGKYQNEWGTASGDNNFERDFIGNDFGIYTTHPINSNIVGDFINNNTAILQKSYMSGIKNVQGNFIANTTTAIQSEHNITLLNSNFFDNTNGAITQGNSGYDSGPQPRNLDIKESSFINNFVDVSAKQEILEQELVQYPEDQKKLYSLYYATLIPLGGGAIANSGLMNVNDSVFIGNHSTNGNGGAINTTVGDIQLGTQLGLIIGAYNSMSHLVELKKVKLNIVDSNGTVLHEGYSVKMIIPTEISGGSEPEEQILSKSTMSYAYIFKNAKISTDIETVDLTIPEGETVDLGEISAELYDDIESLDFLDFRLTMGSAQINNTSFIDNYAVSTGDLQVKGGAIYSAGDINIVASDSKDVVFKGNYTLNNGIKDNNAIHVAHNAEYLFEIENNQLSKQSIKFTPGILLLSAGSGGRIFMYDKISGDNGSTLIPDLNATDLQFEVDEIPHYSINFIGDETGHIYLLNDVENEPNVGLFKTNLHLGRENVLDGSRLSLNSGNLYTINNQIGTMNLGSLSVVGDTNMYVDVDLAKKQMDKPVATTYGQHSGNINVAGMNLLSDTIEDVTLIKFAETGLMDNVVNKVNLEDKAYQSVAYTPIYKYNVSYDKRANDGGYFVFARSGGSSGSAESFNPAVLGSSSAASVGATATMNQAFNYAFQNSADYMNIPYLERVSMKNRNRYALSLTGDGVDMGRYSPLYQPSQEEASVWVKPYATFETVGLKNGPKVHNNTYGTLIGFDTQMQSIKRGWDRVFTGYIGYNGASQRYSGIDSTQNGGLLGGTMTLYKGNFFNATTVSVGASVANNQTMYGNEDFAMLLSGIGNKTGYNFEFKEGKLILQPSMLMSYTFVNTFDYTNAAGVRIDNKPLHALQLAPGVKVIGNLKGGWQPYASVQMVWNLMGESNATANGVKLPEMSIKPYVQYGVGVQKRIKDHFTAYGQAMVQNGGRNGVSLTAGFRWALGHDNCKYEKTQRHPEVKTEGSLTSKEILRSAQNDGSRKILKQMTPEQKMAHGGKYMNTSRTAKTGSLRQY